MGCAAVIERVADVISALLVSGFSLQVTLRSALTSRYTEACQVKGYLNHTVSVKYTISLSRRTRELRKASALGMNPAV
jgi:hypothetical protein